LPRVSGTSAEHFLDLIADYSILQLFSTFVTISLDFRFTFAIMRVE